MEIPTILTVGMGQKTSKNENLKFQTIFVGSFQLINSVGIFVKINRTIEEC